MLPVLILAAAALPTIDFTIDPKKPEPTQSFRVRVLAQSLPCKNVQEIRFDAPRELLLIGKSHSESAIGCEHIFVFSSTNAGRYLVKNINATSTIGKLTHDNFEIVVGNPPPIEPQAPKENPEAEIRSLIGKAKPFLANYLSTEKQIGPFTIESCRIPVAKFVALLLRSIASFTHSYAFKNACDVNGEITVRLEAPIPLDLLVRNVDPVQRVKGTLTIEAKPNINLEFELKAKIEQGQIFEYGNQEIAKFSYLHQKTLRLNVRSMLAQEIANKGELTITEYHGQPVNIKEPVELDRLELQR